MEELSIVKTYSREEQQRYTKIPFTVGGDIEQIEISYNYQRHMLKNHEWGVSKEEVNIIDLGLFSPDGNLRGWSGSERNTVYIGASDASPGYKRGAIPPGTWHIALGIYKVTNQVQVSITINLKEKERRWFKGDLHMHTLNSDGIYTTREVITYARHTGLDFIALTDHNNTQQNQEIGNPIGITVLPGMEYTNYRGHANLFFTDTTEFAENPLSNTHEEMLTVLEAARRREALVSINHPFDINCPWLWGFDGPFTLVEVWNGFFKESDAEAITWWRTQLKEGKRLVAVGGSDTHRIEQGRSFGTPTTYIHAISTGKEDLLEALKEGRVSISATPSSAQLDLVIAEVHIGGSVRYSAGMTGSIQIKSAKVGDRIVLHSNEGLEQSWEAAYAGTLSIPFLVQKREFYQAELYRRTLAFEMLNAMTNPVYLS